MIVPDSADGRDFAALFAATRIEIRLTPDFKTEVWKKLCVNSAGAVSGILNQPASVSRNDSIAEIMRGIVRECIAVGRAEGAKLEESLATTVVEGYRKAPPDSINSLHADRIAGRPMEIDARNGVIVRLGARHGIPTPRNEMAVALLQSLQSLSAR
jgi:2-dehydropantoate 2-reductase